MANPRGGRREVVTAGEAIALSDESIFVSRVDIQAMSANTESIFIGGPELRSEDGFDNGFELAPLETVNFQNCNLNQIFINSNVAGEGVRYLVS